MILRRAIPKLALSLGTELRCLSRNQPAATAMSLPQAARPAGPARGRPCPVEGAAAALRRSGSVECLASAAGAGHQPRHAAAAGISLRWGRRHVALPAEMWGAASLALQLTRSTSSGLTRVASAWSQVRDEPFRGRVQVAGAASGLQGFGRGSCRRQQA